VVGNEVEHHFEAGSVGACDQRFELDHAVGHVVGEVGANVVVIAHSVGRAGAALHHIGAIGG